MKTKTLTFAAMGAVMIAMCAWIRIPATIPFTLQTFAVFLILHTLGGKRGTLSILVYILMGTIGIPVFAGFTGGPGVLFGNTGGYILGFLLCGLVHWLAEIFLGAGRFGLIVADFVGLVLCYLFGSAWFMLVASHSGSAYSFTAVLGMCVVPFVLLDVIKILAAVTVGKRLSAALKTALMVQ